MYNSNKKLNILISCGSYSWGGLEMFTLETAKKLAEKGQNINIICSDNSKLQKESQNAGFKVLPYFKKDYNIPIAIRKLKKYLTRNPVDVIHTNHSHDLWVLTPALGKNNLNTKLFLTKHMASGIKKKDIFHKYIYKRMNAVFAISNYIRQSLIKTVPIKENKIKLLPVGIDLKRFDRKKYNTAEIKNELKLPAKKLTIGITGRMTPGKGYEDFLEAAKILNERFIDKIHFLAIGNASFGEEEYEKSVKELSVKLQIENITFAGHLDLPEKYMTAIDILVFPSHDESFGRVLLEAMALEIPTAASRFAGVLDITVEGETGLLFNRMDPKDISEKLSQLIQNPELCKKFSAAGRKRAEDVFNLDNMINELINYYSN